MSTYTRNRLTIFRLLLALPDIEIMMIAMGRKNYTLQTVLIARMIVAMGED